MQSKFKVYRSARFDKELAKNEKSIQQHVERIESELSANPYSGKPLGLKWFREKKHENYRVYYLVYEDLQSVFMVAISGKKDQQKVINTIKLLLKLFKEELINTIKDNDEIT
jgi:mRNA-degrading endonuclease RelE of RelBE toxin-antitoxin system